jgi:tetratricopeptide (TPR) repeat protein
MSEEVVLRIAGAGTEYLLVRPHLLPRAVDPESMLAAARALIATHKHAGASREAARARSGAGFMLLCAGHAEEAAALLRQAIDEQRLLADDEGRAASEMRLIQALQHLGQLDEALAQAEQVASELERRASPLLHYALHHLGKVQLQAGQVTRARRSLTQARALRQVLGHAELVDSTEQALALLPSTR